MRIPAFGILLGLLMAGLGASASSGPAMAQGKSIVIKTAVNPIVSSNLPVLIAIEKGYFADENIDLKVQKYNGSSVTQMPFLAPVVVK